ncbi:unnamed protein product [Somion occarium]|uniref:WD40 repeat-like protein n=1 Tax=Somion occarium TaxID=3059160 RepID=A0ABP1DQQ4_9APHY
MPDPFFSTNKPRKRKRSNTIEDGPSTSKKPDRSTNGKPFTAKGKKFGSGQANIKSKRSVRDEELSDATSEGDEGGVDEMDLRAPDVDVYESGEEDEDETPAEKRLRLAKLYLESVKQDLTLADGEYDAAEIDKELISARLKQDVMEHSGKLHLFIADNYDFSNTPTLKTRGHRFSVTAAVASEDARWFYTSSKDASIIKWDLSTGRKSHVFHKARPVKDKGKGKAKAEPAAELKGHSDEIWAIALSPDGRLLASGGKDRRIGVWDVEKDEWVKGFGGHRDSISSLAFRKASKTATSTPPSQLYTGSFDRTLKLFDLAPTTMGYVETLFGHQAPVLAIDALMRETAVSVGGRDKSVRYWKIPEESQLVFRGGGRSGWEDLLAGGLDNDMDVDGEGEGKTRRGTGKTEKFIEGSIECVAMIDENTFVSGGDSGSICLWATQKKKPIFTQALAHGMDESQVETEDVEIVRKPRWVTALGCLRYSDLFASGSWDGEIRLWKVDSKMRSFSLVGSIPALGVVNSIQILTAPRDKIEHFPWVSSTSQDPKDGPNAAPVINGHAPAASSSSSSKKSLLLVAGVGQETKFGRWVEKRGEGVLNGALVVAVHPRTLTS